MNDTEQSFSLLARYYRDQQLLSCHPMSIKVMPVNESLSLSNGEASWVGNRRSLIIISACRCNVVSSSYWDNDVFADVATEACVISRFVTNERRAYITQQFRTTSSASRLHSPYFPVSPATPGLAKYPYGLTWARRIVIPMRAPANVAAMTVSVKLWGFICIRVATVWEK